MVSVIIPVYNEKGTISEIINKIKVSLIDIDYEIIVVDDASVDGTGLILDGLLGQDQFTLIRHTLNKGKGSSIKSALSRVRGEIVVIQDADLEYDPKDIPILVEEIISRRAEVVYGSRNLDNNNIPGYKMYYWGGRFLSLLCSFLYGQRLTDINTGYKVFSTRILKSICLESSGFEFCEEVTAKILRRGIKIREIPINYKPRTFSEGKKIHYWDGLLAIVTLIRYRF